MANEFDLATTEELAKELKRSPETLTRWRRLRQGPPFIRLQGRVVYSREQVQTWLKSQTCQAAA